MEKIKNIYCIKGIMANSNSYLIDNNYDSKYDYILVDTGTGESKDYLYDKLEEIGINKDDIDLIVNTHWHYDHVGGNDFFPNAKISIHKEDSKALLNSDGVSNVLTLFDSKIGRRDVDIELEEGDEIAGLTVLNTPGHTNGGICLYDGEILICGDTVFVNGKVGRMDIGGNLNDMQESLMRLNDLDVEYLLPGHGPWAKNGNQHIKMACIMMGIG